MERYSCLCIRRLNIVKTPQIQYRVNAIPPQTPPSFCAENWKDDPEIHTGTQGAQEDQVKTILKKNKVGGLTPTDFKTH